MDNLLKITIGQAFENAAARYPDSIALWYLEPEYKCTFRQLNAEVETLAKGLLGLGLKHGEHLAVWALNVPQWVQLYLAAAKLGLVLVPVNTHFRSEELRFILQHSDSASLFAAKGAKENEYVEIINELFPELSNVSGNMLNNNDFPKLRTVAFIDGEQSGMLSWSDVVEAGNAVSGNEYAKAKAAVSCDDIAAILYTSGTTGHPKGVMLTHYNLLNDAYFWGKVRGDVPGKTHLMPFPLFHSGGMTTLLANLISGITSMPLQRFTPVGALQAIHTGKCSLMCGVPTMYYGIINHPDFDNYDCSSMKKIVTTGAYCTPQLFEDIERHFTSAKALGSYGLTECSPISTQNTFDAPSESRFNTVGYPMPHVEIKIVDKQTGAEVPAGVLGEIMIRGFNVMKGYYKQPEETARTIEKDGWLHTGDLAMMDEKGYISFKGRLKELIIRGGENIDSAEIEAFLGSHPAISQAQAVGVPSEKYGEEVFVFVRPKPGHTISEAEVIDYVRNHLATFKVPCGAAVVEQFPLTASGKVQKFVLRDMAKEIVTRQEIRYTIDKATAEEIQDFFIRMENTYQPPLSRDTDLGEWAARLREFGTTVEAWQGEELVGCSMFYINRPETKDAFGSMILVTPELRGSSVFPTLQDMSFQLAKDKGFERFLFQVWKSQTKLIEYYKRYGAKYLRDKDDKDIYMYFPL